MPASQSSASTKADAVHALIDREDDARRRGLEALPGDAVDAVRGLERHVVEHPALGEELGDDAADILGERDAARREAADGIDVGREDLEARQEGFGDRAPAFPIGLDLDIPKHRKKLRHAGARMRLAVALARAEAEDGAAGDQAALDIVATKAAGFAQVGKAALARIDEAALRRRQRLRRDVIEMDRHDRAVLVGDESIGIAVRREEELARGKAPAV